MSNMSNESSSKIDSFFKEKTRFNIVWEALGIGFNVKKTLLLLLILFSYPILIQIIYILYFNRLDILNGVIINIIGIFMLVIIALIFTCLSKYGVIGLEALFNPFYGKKREEMQKLFISEQNYKEICMNFFKSIYNIKRALLFVLSFFVLYILYTILTFPGTFGFIIGNKIYNWSPFDIISYAILNIAIMLTLAYFILIIYLIFTALIKIFRLKKSDEDLSITHYNKNLRQLLFEKENKNINLSQEIEYSYVYFQKAYRNLGILMFNFNAFFMLISLAIAFIPFSFSLIIYEFRTQALIYTYLGIVLSILAFIFFVVPQFGIHHLLNDKKTEIIDILIQKREILESFYFKALQNPSFIKTKEIWISREELMSDINFLKSTIEDIKSYGTWAYDFPKVLKLFIAAVTTLIPLFLQFIKI